MMGRSENMLQEGLRKLEAGESFEACRSELLEEEAALLDLAAELRAMPYPERASNTVAAQRAELLRAAREQRGTSSAPEQKGEGIGGISPPRWAPLAALSGVATLLIVCAGVTLAVAGGLWLWGSSRQRLAEEPSLSPGSEQVQIEPAPPALEAPDPQSAVLTDALGQVEVQAPDGDWHAVRSGQRVNTGDRLRTGALSGATLAFYDGSQARLGPETEISLDELDARTSGGPRVVALTQWGGETSHDVTPSNVAGSRYEVRTPSGVGAAQGTSFNVLVTSTLLTRFNVDEGSVAVTSLNVTVVAVAGQSTTINPGEPPQEPSLQITGEGEVTRVGSQWGIAGQSFLTNANTLIMGSPQPGDMVSVEARILPDGTRFADRIVLLGRSAENSFEFTGIVGALEDTVWTISGQSVRLDPNTTIDTTVQAGHLVHVRGVFAGDGTFLAESIGEAEDSTLGHPFHFAGVVQSMGDSWTISDVLVAIDDHTGVDGTLAVGEVVIVRGLILPDGTWLASSLKPDGQGEREFGFSGSVESIDPWIVGGIAIDTRFFTEMEGRIEVGDFVTVDGQVLEDGSWLAGEIKLPDQDQDDDDAQRFEFVGRVTSTDPWAVGGVTLAVDEQTEIGSNITIGNVVKVKGTILPDGTLLAEQLVDEGDDRDGLGCLDTSAIVQSVSVNQLVLLNWQTVDLHEGIEVEGDIQVASVIVVHACASDNGLITNVSITVVYQLDVLPPPPPASAPGTAGGGNDDHQEDDSYHDDDDD